MTTIKISPQKLKEAFNSMADRLLDPGQLGGPWFNGSYEQLENWAGDVFWEASEYYMEALGIQLDWEEQN